MTKDEFEAHMEALRDEWLRDPTASYPHGRLAYLKWPVPSSLTYVDGVEALKTWQAGRCASCGSSLRRLFEDHDHQTGLLRGLLCGSCNVQEGFGSSYYDQYRERPPAALLGIVQLYKKAKFGPAKPPRMYFDDYLRFEALIRKRERIERALDAQEMSGK